MGTLQKIIHILPSNKAGKPILLDISFYPDHHKKPVVIFVHGFKGFKDWGPFPLMADYFAEEGFVFLKLNLSHNGTTVDSPTEFSDLEAFGNDNFSIQMDDLSLVLDFVEKGCGGILSEIDTDRISLVGHSRGGSLVLLKASEDRRVNKIVTWSAVSDILSAYRPEDIEDWKKTGVRWIANARTRQQMPVYYQFYEDQIHNRTRLEVLSAAKKIRQPLLILHGEKDETIPLSDAYEIHQSVHHSQLEIIPGANHTFGSTHPYTFKNLPDGLKLVCDKTIAFLK